MILLFPSSGSTFSLKDKFDNNKDNSGKVLEEHSYIGPDSPEYLGAFVWELTTTEKS